VRIVALAAVLVLAFVSLGLAAPDEDKLGKQAGYPVGNASNWYYAEAVRVGSFTHQADIPGIFRGKVNVLRPAAKPMPLPKAASEPGLRWGARDAR